MSFIGNIYKKLVTDEIFDNESIPNVAEWERFLKSLPIPTDQIDEAFLKYRCRMHYFPKWKEILLNIASSIILPVALLKSAGKKDSLPPLKEKKLLLEEKKEVNPDDVFPKEIVQFYDSFQIVKRIKYDYRKISVEGKKLFRSVAKRYYRKPYFLLWVYKELALHSQYIIDYNPHAVIVYIEERNVAGPILTEFYSRNNREFLSFMHGEYLLQLIQGYMHFKRYYIWDDFYKKIFSEDLNCRIEEYVTYTPKKLQKKWKLESVKPDVFCTYYFSAETIKSVRTISELFKEFETAGKICKVRPHPRGSRLDIIKQYFPTDMIELPEETSMEKSLGRTNYIIGLTTTVHSEAYFEGRTVVIDDLSEPEMFSNLENREYICLQRPHMLLSELKKKVLQGEV